MRIVSFFKTVSATSLALGLLAAGDERVAAADFHQTNLVSDIPGLATVTDPGLKNPWGMSQLGQGPFWVSDQATNLATLYKVTGATNVSNAGLVVSLPGPSKGPTGQVSNANLVSFQVGGSRALFIFATLDGTIAAWNPSLGTSAAVQRETPGAVYTGLGINTAQTELYAANAVGGTIDVFDSMFAPVVLQPGAFATPVAIAASGFRPFNVQDLGGTVFVTYAPPDDDEATAGQGAVAEFTEDGALITTIVGAPLASPWGLAWAPAGFGTFGGDLLIGNESAADPGINAYDPVSRTFVGSISIDPGAGNEVGAIWGIRFGFGNNGGDPNTLYFVDGLNDESNGLFGAITTPSATVPELPTWAMLLAGFGGLGLAGYRKARRKGA
jgi:uncharacterized protein (TIGR03118 family)